MTCFSVMPALNRISERAVLDMIQTRMPCMFKTQLKHDFGDKPHSAIDCRPLLP